MAGSSPILLVRSGRKLQQLLCRELENTCRGGWLLPAISRPGRRRGVIKPNQPSPRSHGPSSVEGRPHRLRGVECKKPVGSQFRSAAILLSFCFPSAVGQPPMIDQTWAWNQTRATPEHRAESRPPCGLCSTSRCCLFAVRSPSSEAAESRRSSSLPCASSSRRTPRRDRSPRLTPLDRAFWVALSRFWPRWRDTLVIVKPDTVIRWHRKGFRLYWRAISKRGPGRPPISEEVKALIRRLAEREWLACAEDPRRTREARLHRRASQPSRVISRREHLIDAQAAALDDVPPEPQGRALHCEWTSSSSRRQESGAL